MKITNNRKGKGTPFHEINIGSVFIFGEGVYMRHDVDARFNVVNLRNGYCSEFADHVEVTPVIAELILT